MKEQKILVIEDDPDHAVLIIDVFESEGIMSDVILMNDGQEVIDYFQERDSSTEDEQSNIDGDRGDNECSQIVLIILDINLPKISGMEILIHLKSSPRYRSIPIVILSTSSDQKTISEALRNGADNYITKPMCYDEFVDKIKLLREYWSDVGLSHKN